MEITLVDVEKIVIDYINSKVDTNKIFVSDSIPNDRPSDKMVIIEATGGNSSHYTTIDETALALQFYAPDREQAYSLARQIHAIMPDIADEVVDVLSYSQGVPYN